MADVLAGLLARVEQRSGITTSLRADGDGNLPPVTEREVARIAQEAITNAERHSGPAVSTCVGTATTWLQSLKSWTTVVVWRPLRRFAATPLGSLV